MSESNNTNKTTVNQSELVCRGCLKEWGEMKNMYQWGLDEDFFKYTNIPRNKHETSDGLPELLCAACEADLLKTKAFKDTCQLSDRILKLNLIKNSSLTAPNTSQVTSILQNKTVVLKITAPNPEQKIKLTCPYKDCSSVFINKNQLHTHLKHIHDADSDVEIEQQYFCDEENCVYNKNSNSNKYFTGRKFLNQHRNKKHKDKIYDCESCSNKFVLQSEYTRHLKSCNMVYFCPLCHKTYTTNETYLVHLLRKHPKLHAKYKNDKKAYKRAIDSDPSIDIPIPQKKKFRRLLNNAISIPLIGTPANLVPLRTGIPETEALLDQVTEEIPENNDTNKVVVQNNPEPVKNTDQNTTADDKIDTKVKTYASSKNNVIKIRKDQILKQTVNEINAVYNDTSEVKEITEHNGYSDIVPANNLVDINTDVIHEQVVEVSNTEDVPTVKPVTKFSPWELNIDAFETTIPNNEEYTQNFDNYAIEEIVHEEIVDEETTVYNIEEVTVSHDIGKKTSGTQIPEDMTDVSLNSWTNKNDFEIQTDDMSTQTVFEDLLSIKSQQSVDEIFFSESVSLSDIQTQTAPLEFGLSRCNKETQACTLNMPDLSIKETQTCFCLYDSPKLNFRLFDSLSSSHFISTETQTLDSRTAVRSDVLLSFSSAETQTCFDDSDGSM